MRFYFLVLLFAVSITGNAQICRGQILDAHSSKPLEYVSMGIVNKNVGTVSSIEGLYAIQIDSHHDSDTIALSCIGYQTKLMLVSRFKEKSDQEIKLLPKEINLQEVIVNSVKLKEKTLGNKFSGIKLDAGFSRNKRGYEIGVLLRIDKPTHLQEMAFNMVKCSYNKLLYRLNIYRYKGENDFENILQQPIYVNQSIDESTPQIKVDLSEYNIAVDHDILVTLEHINDMGEGWLTFSARNNIAKGSTCYYRHTSQGKWEKAPYKFGFSVLVKEEQL